MNREQMEAHLTLHGWSPINVGACGAIRDEVIIYTFTRVTGEAVAQRQSPFGLSLTTAALARKAESGWFTSGKYFWPMAHMCCGQQQEEKL